MPSFRPRIGLDTSYICLPMDPACWQHRKGIILVRYEASRGIPGRIQEKSGRNPGLPEGCVGLEIQVRQLARNDYRIVGSIFPILQPKSIKTKRVTRYPGIIQGLSREPWISSFCSFFYLFFHTCSLYIYVSSILLLLSFYSFSFMISLFL